MKVTTRPNELERMSIFVEIKKAGWTNVKSVQQIVNPYPPQILSGYFVESSFNSLFKLKGMTIYLRNRVSGAIYWIAVSNDTGTQYRLVKQEKRW